VYLERVKTTRIFVRDVTPVPPHALLLFARGAVEAPPTTSSTSSSSAFGRFGNNNNEDVVVRLDGWLGIRVPRRDLEARMLASSVQAVVVQYKYLFIYPPRAEI